MTSMKNEIKLQMNTKRNAIVDIIKALGIIGMVWGHSGGPFTHFIYLFHMAVFFIASGFCYSERNHTNFANLKKFIVRKIKSLWVPYTLWTTIYTLLHNFFIRINIYSSIQYSDGITINSTLYWTKSDMLKNIAKSLIMHGGTEMGGALWFLSTLFYIAIGYCLVGYVLSFLFKSNLRKIWISQWILSILFLFIGYECYIFGYSFYGTSKIFSFYILFHGGYCIKQGNLENKEKSNAQHLAVLSISLLILCVLNKFGSIDLVGNSYVNPAYFLTVSFAGWQLLYEIGFYISKFKPLSKVFGIIGQNTLAVVVLHFLCFKIISYIGLTAQSQPLFYLAAFPILYRDGVWWIAYTFAGLVIPVSLSILWKQTKNIFFHSTI